MRNRFAELLSASFNNGYKQLVKSIFYHKLFIGFILSASFCLYNCTSSSSQSGDSGSDSWTIFRGDAALTGCTETKLPRNPALRWTYKSDSRTSSSPVIDAGTTYWSDKRGNIYGVDIDGKLIFEYQFHTAIEASPMIRHNRLYIGRIDGIMSSLSLEQRDTTWNFETMGQIAASPNSINLEGNEAIVFGSYDNYFYTLNDRTGKVINRFESGYYINGAAAVWKNYILYGGCDSWLRIMDAQTGLATDSMKMDAYIPASPAVRDNYCYVGDYVGNVYELYLENGIIAHSKKIVESGNENSSFVSVPAVSDKLLYILSDDRYVYAVNRNNGTVKWKYLQKGESGESSPVVCADQVLVCTKTGIISILHAGTGKLIWEYDAGEQITASPAVIKDHFFVLTTKGTLFCFGEK